MNIHIHNGTAQWTKIRDQEFINSMTVKIVSEICLNCLKSVCKVYLDVSSSVMTSFSMRSSHNMLVQILRNCEKPEIPVA